MMFTCMWVFRRSTRVKRLHDTLRHHKFDSSLKKEFIDFTNKIKVIIFVWQFNGLNMHVLDMYWMFGSQLMALFWEVLNILVGESSHTGHCAFMTIYLFLSLFFLSPMKWTDSPCPAHSGHHDILPHHGHRLNRAMTWNVRKHKLK